MTNWGRAQTPKGAATTQLQPVPMLPSGQLLPELVFNVKSSDFLGKGDRERRHGDP